ncbi:MAG: ATP-binding protein [Prevotella sp.]|nr:ATP-binding protein [Bacteroidaceae bacterium]MBO5314725.1 ATP-binding protein [Prevotella sp.]
MKFPIGIQQFEKLREEDWAYVDKTVHIFNLVQGGTCYFLSRPRRFGKSMLLSTLEAYFQGKKHLFKGLAIEQLETEWAEHAVLHIDLNAKPFQKVEDLYDLLNDQLTIYEKMYDSVAVDKSPEGRLRQLIRAAKQKTGRNVVVLVDEYDKPILQAIGNEELQTEFRNALKAFYGVLKSADGDLRFAMLTGVTKFSKVSVFSDLNNLNDISMDDRYNEICGISQQELHDVFDEEIGKLAVANEQSKEEAYETLRQRYDGYHFCPNASGMYNPFSVLLALQKREYGSFWFSTGTPTYLVQLMKEADLNPYALSGYEASASELDSIQISVDNPIAVLYQSGYLTIKGYDSRFKVYTLDYPNDEVKEGFVNFLVPYYTYSKSVNHATIIGQFVKSLERGDAEHFMELLQSFMAGIPYELVRNLEVHFQNMIYIIIKLMGLYVQAEYRTSCGRIDLLIATEKYIYVIELKLDGSAEEALAQINEKDYALPFTADGRKVIKIGANITSATRNIERWVVGE